MSGDDAQIHKRKRGLLERSQDKEDELIKIQLPVSNLKFKSFNNTRLLQRNFKFLFYHFTIFRLQLFARVTTH